MRRLLALATASLAAASLGGCGGTLYTSEGLPAVATGTGCPQGQQLCGTTVQACVDPATDDRNCGSCGNDCTSVATLPSGATGVCRASQCTFNCPDGKLRNVAGNACETAIALAAGQSHTCAVTSSGLLSCWGSGAAGQLAGSGSAGVTAVAAGQAHTCAVVSGTVNCWPASARNGMPAMAGVVALSAGATHTCAIANGTTTRDLKCWGTGAAAAAPSLTGVDAIASGANHACAVHGGGVTCWGSNTLSQTLGGAPIAGGSGMTSIAAGADFTCAANFGATASPGADPLCWGDNSAGQLPGLASPQTTPATPQRTSGGGGGARPIAKGKQLVALVAGARHVCVAFPAGDADGVGCFGESAFGKLGGTFAGELVGLGTAWAGTTVMAGGGDHTCAVEPGTALVKCWGRNDAGQLGIPSDTLDHVAPTPVSGH